MTSGEGVKNNEAELGPPSPPVWARMSEIRTHSSFSLKGRVAVVLGAGHGIGKAVAHSCAQFGADVLVAGITIHDPSQSLIDLETVASEVRAMGRRALGVPTDARVSEQVRAAMQTALRELGGLDIMVNTSGGTFFVPSLELSENGFDAVLRQNLKSAFLCSQAAAAIMREHQGGSIINIASTSGRGPHPGNLHYAAAKSAIINMTETLAVEWAQYGIRVNAVAPGSIKTDGWRRLYRDRADEMEAAISSGVPLRRMGTPEEVASLIVFLASDAASYITGQTVNIDGGPLSRVPA